jgi:hypothetical protein
MMGTIWTDEECATAAAIYRARAADYGGHTEAVRQISRTLNRTQNAVAARLGARGPLFIAPARKYALRKKNGIGNHMVDTALFLRVPEQILAERDHRLALEHDSLTAALCGDPKPGYSALHRKMP